jgi:hypothetical protein
MTNGFGLATNDALMAALGRLRLYCSNEEQYLNAALPPIISNDGSSLLKLQYELLRASLGTSNILDATKTSKISHSLVDSCAALGARRLSVGDTFP